MLKYTGILLLVVGIATLAQCQSSTESTDESAIGYDEPAGTTFEPVEVFSGASDSDSVPVPERSTESTPVEPTSTVAPVDCQSQAGSLEECEDCCAAGSLSGVLQRKNGSMICNCWDSVRGKPAH